ncbi:hypothetical protein [Laceyella putida]|uniref:Uncharacterized protein n=1 Tax=Laceyella putida TaxID=110101 RepID=A0ABW2RLF0_9BACL
MLVFYLIIAILFLGGGVYQLFVAQLPAAYAIHSFLVALYFYVTYHELRGKPFPRNIYVLTIVLLVADGLVNLLIVSISILSGIVSFFFAFLCFQSYRRIYRQRA